MLRFEAQNRAESMDLSIKGVPEEQVARLRVRAKANHRSLCDAGHLWFAALGAELVTLDRKLAAADAELRGAR
jgi:plasmid stability protein